MDALIKHDFPGNVRELENIIERATVLVPGDVIGLSDLPAALRKAGSAGTGPLPAIGEVQGNMPEILEELERRIVLETLVKYGGNQSSAARHLGLTESGLRYKLKKWQGSED